jgi:Ulp1 family protease
MGASQSTSATESTVTLAGNVIAAQSSSIGDKHKKLLTPAQHAQVDNALNPQLEASEVLAYIDHTIITRNTLIQYAAPGAWLNDEIINAYFKLLQRRNVSERIAGLRVPRIFVVSTFLYEKLTEPKGADRQREYDFSNVARWARRTGMKIAEYDRIFFPINVGENHWILVVAFVNEKVVQAYDSFGHSQWEVSNTILRYLQDEWAQQHEGASLQGWSVSLDAVSDLPMQTNNFDCGVFVCMYADYLSENLPFTFTKRDLPFFRLRLIWTLLNKEVPITLPLDSDVEDVSEVELLSESSRKRARI